MITDNDEMNDDDGCGGGPRLAFTKIILKVICMSCYHMRELR